MCRVKLSLFFMFICRIFCLFDLFSLLVLVNKDEYYIYILTNSATLVRIRKANR